MMRIVACGIALVATLLMGACNGGTTSTSAASFTPEYREASFDSAAAQGDDTHKVDFSHTSQGYIGVSSTGEGKLKAHVQNGEVSYHYDLPSDGSPIIIPVNMGDGHYVVRVMQNTEGNRYLELFEAEADIVLDSALEPYLRPNVFCNYDQNSACAVLATELCAGAKTEGEAFDAIFDFVSKNIDYDKEKAARLADATGYVPNPDETLASRSGVCFDYASLMAAMLRSQGIPCKIVTGYVSPDNIYHAWDMIYLDGSWSSVYISAQGDNWARADMTFAATGAGATIGDGSSYNDRYTY